jgi:catechol 2,3-dioxygenase
MSAVRGIGEIVLFVKDVEGSLRFYRDALRLKVMARPDSRGAVFLQAGEAAVACPQQIVLVPLPQDAPALPSERTKRALHHLGLEIAEDAFESERERLAGLGYDVRTGEHPLLPLKGMYIDDPDGNEVELISARS